MPNDVFPMANASSIPNLQPSMPGSTSTTSANFHNYAQPRPGQQPLPDFASDPFKCSNAPNKVAPEMRPPFDMSLPSVNSNLESRCSSVESNIPAGLDNLVTSLPLEPAQHRKDWHLQIKEDLRYHLIVKLFKAIYPSNDLDDSRVRDVLNYARKVEREFFEHANDRVRVWVW